MHLTPRETTPERLAPVLDGGPRRGQRAPRFARPAYDVASPVEVLAEATNGLRTEHPELSAAEPVWLWQKLALAVFPLLVGAFVVAQGSAALGVLLLAMGLPFFAILILRLLPLVYAGTPKRAAAAPATKLSDDALPTYTILVPLLAEAEVAPNLVEALSALDYPAAKLEILLLVEARDTDTQDALARAGLAPHMRIEIVPPGKPRTKPRALNYGLARSSGDLVVVYDAEDNPEPDQLRLAAAVLAARPDLGCVQARLNIYNLHEAWLTRQFTIEYSVLFDHMLPMLARFGLPVPLGGTSNHFPRRALEAVGAWDPFNVTEDADLGIRLARCGWKVDVLASTTWEEAPPTRAGWTGQRTRWLKGWLQTFLVHMREPRRCATELGLIPFLGLQCLAGGMLLSAIVHPWVYLLLGLQMAGVELFSLPGGELVSLLANIGIFNFIAGHIGGIVLGMVAAKERGQRRLVWQALFMPIYWIMISLACYRAIGEFISAPFHWAKTVHRGRAGAITTSRVADPDGNP